MTKHEWTLGIAKHEWTLGEQLGVMRLVDEIKQLRAEVKRLREALEEIAEAPLIYDGDYAELRRVRHTARAALDAAREAGDGD
jgi:hypothetical protein